jgi:hypothetical protein
VDDSLLTRIIIYSPAYDRSPGTKYRIDMMKKALEKEHTVQIVIDEREEILSTLYRYLGKTLLNHNFFWDLIGKTISNKLVNLKPDVVVLIFDVSASAIPHLNQHGIKTILSVEDLTWEWLKIKNDSIKRIFTEKSKDSDGIITTSDALYTKLHYLGIESLIVPHGLDLINATPENRKEQLQKKLILLHSGKIQNYEESIAFEKMMKQLTNRYEILSYQNGDMNSKLSRKYPEITWYNYEKQDELLDNLSKASIGIIIRYNANSPTRKYFHASLLQPVIAIGDNWTEEIEKHEIGVVCDPEKIVEAINQITENYDKYVANTNKYAESNLIENTYKPLLELINKL